MPLSVQSLVNEMASALDANPDAIGAGKSDYYKFETDYVPALNYAILQVETIINAKLGSNKFSEDALREVINTWCFQTSKYSRVSIPDNVWTIGVVYGEPTTDPASPSITVVDDRVSLYRPDIYFVGAFDGAKRYTTEQYAENRGNPLSPAYALEKRKLGNYAMKNMTQYNSSAVITVKNVTTPFAAGDTLTDTQTAATATIVSISGSNLTVNFINGVFNGDDDLTATPSAGVGQVDAPAGFPVNGVREIEIAPYVSKGIVAMEITKYPAMVKLITGTIEFPVQLSYFIVNLALLWIAYKQGDQTNVAGLSLDQIRQEAKIYV